MNKDTKDNLQTVRVVFISLLLDLLAFTMILPLLPSLLDHYEGLEKGNGLYSAILQYIQRIQLFLNAPDKTSSVLYGGFLGSMFSFLQFLGSPIIGALSDVYGRKSILVLCLIGIASSYLLWALSQNFILFVIARIIGGISKGNISLSMAIITDVTSPISRGRAMALVGIAFSVGFIVGPMIGAFFAWYFTNKKNGNWFVAPALFALSLSLIDLTYIVCKLKESLPSKYRARSLATGIAGAISYINPIDLFQFNGVNGLKDKEKEKLKILGHVYFIYLFIYSGLEFTITFLTHYSFKFTSMQQGWMFLAMGLIMAILQGGWIRHIPQNKTKLICELGLWLIIPAFILIGIAKTIYTLYVGIILFAVSTAMVVTCMMTLVSRIGPENQKGTITGIFRSLGALARACGPIVASTAFWWIGAQSTYLIGAVVLIVPSVLLHFASN